MKRLYVFLLCCLTASILMAQNEYQYRDVVYLKNGSVIKGFYKSFYVGDSLRMETIDGGILVCAFSDIKRIAKERTDIYVLKENEKIERDGSTFRPKGYAGSISYGTTLNLSDNDMHGNVVSTTHGYNFNPHFFLGAGLSLATSNYTTNSVSVNFKKNNIAAYGAMRINLIRRIITPVIDLRSGYCFSGSNGFFVKSALGADFGFTRRFGLTVSLGYRYFRYHYSKSEEGGSSTTVFANMHDIFARLDINF